MSTADTPRDPTAAGRLRQPDGSELPPEPIGTTQQFQAFASRTEEQDERAGEQLPGPDIPDVIPEDPPAPDAVAFGDEPAFGAEPAASGIDPAAEAAESATFGTQPAAFGDPPESTHAASDQSGSQPVVGSEPADLPPVRTDRGRALLLAAAVCVLVAVAVILLIMLL